MKNRLIAVMFAAVFAALFSSSCRRELAVREDGMGRVPSRRVDFVFAVGEYDEFGTSAASQAKSSIDEGLIDCLYDINALVIDSDGCYCASLSEYFIDYRQCALQLPDDGKSYTVYFLANGGMDIREDFDDGCGVEDILNYCLPSYDMVEDFSSTGLPCVGKVEVEESSGAYIGLTLKRLYSRWLLSIDDSALENCGFSVNSVRVCNGAAELYPFSDESRATVCSDLCDYASDEDCSDIMSGQIVLYTLENCQGDLLPESSGPVDRTYSKVQDWTGYSDGEMSLLTYVEIDAAVSTMTAEYEHVRYRFYLGENQSSSFDVRRNRSTEVNLRLTNELVIGQEWRLEPDDPGEIHYVVTSSAETLFVASGVDGEVTIGHPAGFEYTVEIDSAGDDFELSCERSVNDDEEDCLVFSTTRCDDSYIPPYVTGSDDEWEYDIYSDRQRYIGVKIVGADGIVQKNLVLDCIAAPLGCWYSLDKSPLVMIPNRNGFTYDCHLDLTVYGKGYLGTYSSETSCDFSINPQPGTWQLWTVESQPFRTEAGGWAAYPADITECFDELYSHEADGQISLIGSVSDLTVVCREYPSLKIKLGESPVEFRLSNWRLYGYQPWSIGTDESLSDYGKLMRVTFLDAPVYRWSELEAKLEEIHALHTVNGTPDFNVR